MEAAGEMLGDLQATLTSKFLAASIIMKSATHKHRAA